MSRPARCVFSKLPQKKRAPADPRTGGIVGESQALREVLDKIRIVAKSHSTVLLRGESGTGPKQRDEEQRSHGVNPNTRSKLPAMAARASSTVQSA